MDAKNPMTSLRFKPEDFNKLDDPCLNFMRPEIAAKIANERLAEMLKDSPVAEGDFIDEYWTTHLSPFRSGRWRGKLVDLVEIEEVK